MKTRYKIVWTNFALIKQKRSTKRLFYGILYCGIIVEGLYGLINLLQISLFVLTII